MIAKHELDKDVVAYYASNHGKFLGRMTLYIDEEGKHREKDAYYFASGNGREISEEQARGWVQEMGHDPDKVFDYEFSNAWRDPDHDR